MSRVKGPVIRDENGKEVPQVGDRVSWDSTYRGGSTLKTGRVEGLSQVQTASGSTWYAYVREDGRTPSGRRKGIHCVKNRCLNPIPGLDSREGNVYADWLEENGFHDAADALRRAFPLSETK